MQAVDEEDVFFYNFKPLKGNLPLDNENIGENGAKENFVMQEKSFPN